MSEGSQNIGDEQAVLGEPASHPHQAVVVGEPPEDATPVLGEPAFANGLQDQQPISPPPVNATSANGFQSSPHVPFHEDSSSHVSARSSDPPIVDSPNSQVLAAEAPESDNLEGVTHHLEEAPVAENRSPSSASTDADTQVTHDAVRSVDEEEIPDDVEVTHIQDIPSEAPLPLSEVSTVNPFAALDETDENAPAGDTPVTDDGVPAASASSTPDEMSQKGLGGHQEEASLSSALQGKQSAELLSSAQTDGDDGPLEGRKAVNEDVHDAELEQVYQGDALAQESDSKEVSMEEEGTGSSVVEHPAPELDQVSERDAFVQGHDKNEDIPAGSETASREVEHALSRDIPQSEIPTIESSTPQKDIHNGNHAAPIASESQSTEEPFAEETHIPPTANGNNGYQHCEDGDRAFENEQDLLKDDDASAELEKPSSRIKLPLIFTGLAIAVVGVAVAAISRPH